MTTKDDAPILVDPAEVIAAISDGYVLGYIHASIRRRGGEVQCFLTRKGTTPSAETEAWIRSMYDAIMDAKVRKNGTRKLPIAANHCDDK